jgi:membrane-associated protein
MWSLILDLFTHADRFLVTLATDYGALVYAAMFTIFMLETGVVVLAFLPGDSLLFVAGTVAAAGTMSPLGLIAAVTLGAIVGNTIGFHTGR